MEIRYTLNPDKSKIGEFVQVARNADIVAFDIETTGLDPFTENVLLVQFGTPDGEVLIFSNGVPRVMPDLLEDVVPRVMLDLLEDVVVLGHNLKFDIRWAIQKFGAKFNRVFDTMIVESNLTLGKKMRVGLGHLSSRMLGIELDKGVRKSFIGQTVNSYTPEQLSYAATDVAILFPIMEAQKERIGEMGKLIDLENDTVITTAEMEHNGFGFDMEAWGGVKEGYIGRLLDAVKLVYTLSPNKPRVQMKLRSSPLDVADSLATALELRSNDAVLKALHSLGYKVKDTKASTLAVLAPHCQYARAFGEWREYNTIRTRYLDETKGLASYVNPVTGRIHADYRQIVTFGGTSDGGTVTGRYGCASPNLQQIPRSKELRHLFVAAPGMRTITADYSGQEVCIAGNLFREPTILSFFRGDSGVTDYHGFMANRVFGVPLEEVCKRVVDGVEIDPPRGDLRYMAKTAGFALMYGTTAYGLAWQLDRTIPDGKYTPAQWLRAADQAYKRAVDVAEDVVDGYHKALPVLFGRLAEIGDSAVRDRVVPDFTIGRERAFLPDEDEKRVRRQAGNFPVQGNGANMMKRALRQVRLELPEVNTVGTVHDEGVFEVPESDAQEYGREIARIMSEAGKWVLDGPVPYKVGVMIGPSWTK